MGNVTQLGTDELLKLLDSVYQHSDERTVTINKHDKQLMYDLLDKKFYTATPFNIWDTIDPVKGIVDNLLSHQADHALSANQGRVLKELHDEFYEEYKVFEEKVIDKFAEVDESITALEERSTVIEGRLDEHDTTLDIHGNHLIFHDNQITSLFNLSKINKDNIDINKKSIDVIIESISDLDTRKANKNLSNITDVDFLTKGKQSGLIDEAQKRQPNGVACLDETGKVHVSELPDFILGQVLYGGTISNDTGFAIVTTAFKDKYKYDEDTLQLTIDNATIYESAYFIATSIGTIGTIVYRVGDWIISNGITWTTIGASDAVRTVNGRIGDVFITLAELKGLNNRDDYFNTSYIDLYEGKFATCLTLAGIGKTKHAYIERNERGVLIGVPDMASDKYFTMLLDPTTQNLKVGTNDTPSYNVYHEGNKPVYTATELGAISSQSGKIGSRSSANKVELILNPDGDLTNPIAHITTINKSVYFGNSYNNGSIHINEAGVLNYNKVGTDYPIYHVNNKPSPSDIGAVPVFANNLSNMLYGEFISGGGQCNPNDLKINTIVARMGHTVGGYWCDQLMMDCYNGDNVPYVTALAIKKQHEIQAYVGTGHRTSTQWNTAELWHSQNLNPNKVEGCLIVNPNQVTGSYDEGIRVSTFNGWSVVSLGCDPNKSTGTQAGQWTIAKTGSSELIIDHNGSSSGLFRLTTNKDLYIGNMVYGVNFGFTSDINLKENFKDFNDFNIDDIKLQWYNMIGSDTKRFGIIAQDVLKYAPEFVSGTEWTEDKPDNHLSVANIDLLFLMIAKLRKDLKELKGCQK